MAGVKLYIFWHFVIDLANMNLKNKNIKQTKASHCTWRRSLSIQKCLPLEHLDLVVQALRPKIGASQAVRDIVHKHVGWEPTYLGVLGTMQCFLEPKNLCTEVFLMCTSKLLQNRFSIGLSQREKTLAIVMVHFIIYEKAGDT